MEFQAKKKLCSSKPLCSLENYLAPFYHNIFASIFSESISQGYFIYISNAFSSSQWKQNSSAFTKG
jgi:hypothetical protein